MKFLEEEWQGRSKDRSQHSRLDAVFLRPKQTELFTEAFQFAGRSFFMSRVYTRRKKEMSIQLLEPTPIQLMKTSQAAAFLNITPKRLRAWRSAGIGPPWIRLGEKRQSQCRYHPSVLQEYIEAHTFG